MIVAVNWVTVSSLATAGTTACARLRHLCVRPFRQPLGPRGRASAARRPAPGARPLRHDDPPQKVGFVDDRWFSVPGGRAVVEVSDEAIYMAMGVRNAGNGIAVLHGWHLRTVIGFGDAGHTQAEQFVRLTRDL